MTVVPISFNPLIDLPTLSYERPGQMTWHCDRSLLRNLMVYLTDNPNHTLETLVYQLLLELKQPHPQTITAHHLYAFLSHIVDSIIQKIQTQFKDLPAFKTDRIGFMQDIYQEALIEIINPVEFFQKFDPNYTQSLDFRYPALQSYCRQKIKCRIFETIRQNPGLDDFMRSNLGLAKRASLKSILQALNHSGCSHHQILRCRLTKQCLTEYSQTTSRPVNQYINQDFQHIVDRYNQLSSQLSPQLNISQPMPIDAITIKTWLEEMGESLRLFNQHLHQPKSLTLIKGEDYEIEIPDPNSNRSYDQLEQQERKTQQNQITHFLTHSLALLSPEKNRIPLLMHGLSLVQIQIAKELDKNQSTIARNYQTLLNQLTQRLALWSQETFRISINSEMLRILKDPVEDRLKQYYIGLIDTDLQLTYQSPPPLLPKLVQQIQSHINLTFKPQSSSIDALERLLQDRTP